MPEDTELIDGPVEGTAIELPPAAPSNLFRTDDPAEVLKRAEATANALAPVIRRAGLVSTISGKDYLNVEAWQTLGTQVGVTPLITWTRRLTDPVGWEARCEARTLDGRTLGAAESMCLRSEDRWKDSADFEIRSMAQTRAMSRALASVLRFIPTLAGFAGTPAEEMQNHGGGGQPSRRTPASSGKPPKPSEKQLDYMVTLAKKSGADGSEQETLRAYALEEMTGGRDGSVSESIDKLNGPEAGEHANWLLAQALAWQTRQPDVPPDVAGLGADGPAADDDAPFF